MALTHVDFVDLPTLPLHSPPNRPCFSLDSTSLSRKDRRPLYRHDGMMLGVDAAGESGSEDDEG